MNKQQRPTQARATRAVSYVQPLGPCAAMGCNEPARLPVLWQPDPSNMAKFKTAMCAEHAVVGERAGAVTILGIGNN